jgi:hypothetical protein
MAYGHRPDGVSLFAYILNRSILCEGPTGYEKDEYLYELTLQANEFANTHAIVKCIDEIQYKFALETYSYIVIGRQEGNIFADRIGDVDLDELMYAVDMVTFDKKEVNVDLSSALENIKL